MRPVDWLLLALAVPAASTATIALLAWLFREKGRAWVIRMMDHEEGDALLFRQLDRNHGRWIASAKRVEDFAGAFLEERMADQTREIDRLRQLIQQTSALHVDALAEVRSAVAEQRRALRYYGRDVRKLRTEFTALTTAVAILQDRHKDHAG